jgi:hypothetical protein
MSMNLYVTSGPHTELLQLARSAEQLSALTMSHVMGRMKAFGARGPNFDDLPLSEGAFESHLKTMSRAAWQQGVLQWLLVQWLKGRMRKSFRQSFALQKKVTESGPSDSTGKEILDLHKSWHVLHYLFTGTAWEGKVPENTLLNGGKEVGEDLGYGPARVVDPATTQSFARFLEGLSPGRLKSRLDMKKMAQLEIYCAEDDDDEGSRSELSDDIDNYFPMLTDYVCAAAKRGGGLAIWMA